MGAMTINYPLIESELGALFILKLNRLPVKSDNTFHQPEWFYFGGRRRCG